MGYLILRLIVEGSTCSSMAAIPSGSNRVFSSSSTAGCTISPKPVGTKKNSINVKIVHASAKKGTGRDGRPEFKPLTQAFVEVTESTANVMYLSHIIKEKWGADHILVTADGMKIEDSSGTQGEYNNSMSREERNGILLITLPTFVIVYSCNCTVCSECVH